MKKPVAAAIPDARLDATESGGGLTQLAYTSNPCPIAAAEVLVYVTSDGRAVRAGGRRSIDVNPTD